MEKDKITEIKEEGVGEEADAIELVLFQVSECYVYMVIFNIMFLILALRFCM